MYSSPFFFFLNTIHNVRTPFSLCVARHTHFATTKNEERKMRKNYFLAPLHKHKKKHNNGEKFGIYCTRPSFLDNNERYQLSTFSVSFFERIKKNVKNLFLGFRRDDDDDDDVGQNSKLRNEKQH